MGLYISISNSIGASAISGGARKPTFEFTINTANTSAGSTANNQFKLPLVSSLPLDAKVSWGDGTTNIITAFNQPEVTHTYPSVGTYTISITGNLSGWQFAGGGDRLKMLNVVTWGALNISVDQGFNGCTNLTCSATDAPVITSTSLFAYFNSCSNFNGAIGSWNVSNVLNFEQMLGFCPIFNQPLNSWNISSATRLRNFFINAFAFNQPLNLWITTNVTNMENMFFNATAFNQDIGSWDVSNVTTYASMFSDATAFNNGGSDDINNWTIRTASAVNMSGMFGGSNPTLSCKFNRYIGDWDTSAVNNMSSMFAYNTAFNQNIGSWNTSAVTTMAQMLFFAAAFNQNIGSWNVSNVTNMSLMFTSAGAFNQNIGSWNVSNVTNMQSMFQQASNFNGNIGSWNVSNVTSMSFMFSEVPNFNQNIGSWNVSNVTNMSFMFNGANAFNQDISNWNVSNVANFTNFMAGKSPANYDPLYLSNIYEKWSLLTLRPNISINFGTIQYFPYAQTGKDVLTNAPNNWSCVDGGTTATDPFQFTINTTSTSTGSTGVNQFKLPLVNDGNVLNSFVYWGDGTRSTITAFNQAEVTHTYPTSGNYMINIVGALSGWQFNSGGDRLKMLNVSKWTGLNISVASGFSGCTNLTATALDAPLITSNSLADYFAFCSNFNGAIGNWNLVGVLSISGIFRLCVVFNGNVQNWNTSTIQNMSAVFNNCAAFNQNISTWNTSSVTTMNGMFRQALSFNQNISTWNVSNVTDMTQMFNLAAAFNQDIGNWNVSNVTLFTSFMVNKSAANFSAANLDSIYNGWSSRPVKPNISITFATIKYTAAGQAGKDILTNAPNLWTIVDGGI